MSPHPEDILHRPILLSIDLVVDFSIGLICMNKVEKSLGILSVPATLSLIHIPEETSATHQPSK
jgi:hypothetical protein